MIEQYVMNIWLSIVLQIFDIPLHRNVNEIDTIDTLKRAVTCG